MPRSNIDLMSPREYSKDRVNYRHHESCRTCAFYNGRVYCSKVDGHISPDAVCDQWDIMGDTGPINNKEIIVKAYEEARR